MKKIWLEYKNPDLNNSRQSFKRENGPQLTSQQYGEGERKIERGVEWRWGGWQLFLWYHPLELCQ